MFETLNERSCGVCVCRHFTVGNDCDNPVVTKPQKTPDRVMSKMDALQSLLYRDLRAGIWALMISREIMSDLRFAEGYSYSEDLEMVWRIVASVDQIVVIDEPLYGYRVRPGSAMSKVDNRRLDGLLLFKALSDFIGDKAPEFLEMYQKFGVARWVWATLWQEAAAAKNYREFCIRAEKYCARTYMKQLLSFPRVKVKLTSLLYLISKQCYFWGMSGVGNMRRTLSKCF